MQIKDKRKKSREIYFGRKERYEKEVQNQSCVRIGFTDGILLSVWACGRKCQGIDRGGDSVWRQAPYGRRHRRGDSQRVECHFQMSVVAGELCRCGTALARHPVAHIFQDGHNLARQVVLRYAL